MDAPAPAKSSSRAVQRVMGRLVRQVSDRPGLLGVVAAVALFVGASASMWVLQRTAVAVLERSVRESLLNVVRLASNQVDAEKHALIVDPSQDGSPTYESLAEGLRGVMRYVPELRYAYTFRRSPEGLRFVIDASPRGGYALNGRAEHSEVNELYPDPDEAMLEVIRTQVATVCAEPYRDDWGALFSAYAPVRDSQGRTQCYVGVDLDASTYLTRVAAMGSAMHAGIMVAGIVSCSFGLSVAILRRKRLAADLAAAESSARLERLALNLPGMVYMHRERADGTVQIPFASRGIEKLLGVTPEQLRDDANAGVGLIHEDDVAQVRASIAESKGSLGMWQCEFRVRRTDGQVRWVDARAVPQREPDGAVLWHGYLFDSTERKETEIELQRAKVEAESASRAKSEFVANVSHEIRTPMTAIVGYAELMRDAGTDSGAITQHDAADAIARNADHLLAIINDILDMSRVEAGAMSVQRNPTDLATIASEVLGLLRQRALARGLKLSLAVDPAVPELIYSDAMRVRQILINLVGNSIKFTNEGAISVHIGLAGGQVAIAVRDTGIGMTQTQIGKLFAAFSQVDTSPTRAFGGTGLGLALSKRLARLLGGDVTVTSEPGVGSEFTLLLPAESAGRRRTLGTAAGALQRKAAANDRPLAGARILLAEDGPDNARLISHHLERAGAQVVVAPDGRKAVNAVRQQRDQGEPHSFDLVLMDMQMPDLDGYEATAMLRSDGVSTPIVALTAHATTADRARCMAVGCSDYATKPIPREALLELCKHWVSRLAEAPDLEGLPEGVSARPQLGRSRPPAARAS